MRALGNILWFILGGWWSALFYLALELVCCVTVIGFPIGAKVVSREDVIAMKMANKLRENKR